MNIPTIRGIIRRRILLNYRVDPEILGSLLPPPFRPKLQHGFGIAGICLIRLEQLRPLHIPRFLSLSSENSAHRFAVEWTDEQGKEKEGVYVSRRDTNAWFNSLVGGRLFPGVHHFTQFEVKDTGEKLWMRATQKNRKQPLLELEGEPSERLPEGSVFDSLSDASDYFESGSLGYSSRPRSNDLDGLLLRIEDWNVSPLAVHRVTSSYFDNTELFPAGSISFDHALLMRNAPHEWDAQPRMTLLDPSHTHSF